MWPNLSSGLGGMPKSPVRSLRLTSSIWRCTGMQLVIINNDGLFIQFYLLPKKKKVKPYKPEWAHHSYFSPKRGSQKFINIISKEFFHPLPQLLLPSLRSHPFLHIKSYLIYFFQTALLISRHKQRSGKILKVERIFSLHHLICIFMENPTQVTFVQSTSFFLKNAVIHILYQ